MIDLIVSIEKEGTQVNVGRISGQEASDACFQYDPSYLEGQASRSISLSLPLQEEPFTPHVTRNYFDGLLPEGFTRQSVAQWMHVDAADYLSILACLGRECIGAVRITDALSPVPVKTAYEKLSLTQVEKLAREGATRSAEIVVKTHLSLTGATGKVGLYYDENGSADHSGQPAWYLPRGDAPSTHIVKQSHVRLENIVTNEQLSQMCAGRCGISVPESFIINTGQGRDEDILLATRRYDRCFSESAGAVKGGETLRSSYLNDLEIPFRLHQEDFAQALGISSLYKYETYREDAKAAAEKSTPADGYITRMFDLIRKISANPIEDQARLWDRIVFNYLIGNTDGHLKNYSLLYSQDLTRARLAPAYDVLSTVVYEQSTRDMSFAIGGKFDLHAITRSDFEAAAVQAGLGRKMAMSRFDRLCDQFENALQEAADELTLQGFPGVSAMKERILAEGGYRRA